MRRISRKDIDVKKWDALVGREKGHFFSRSWYLDALADDWCIFEDENYSRGIAIAFTNQLGVKMAYTPVFSRNTEWLGQRPDQEEFVEMLTAHFNVIDTSFGSALLGDNYDEFVFQTITPEDEQTLNKQAERMLKKADNAGLEVELSYDYALVEKTISNELTGKFGGVNRKSVRRLGTLFSSALEQKVLRSFVLKGHELGGIVCLEDEQRLLYLKGTVNEETKKLGGMYLLMNEAIQYARQKNLVFDFGGSRIDGVRRFNRNLGGKDSVYFHYAIDNAPGWFRNLKGMKSKLGL